MLLHSVVLQRYALDLFYLQLDDILSTAREESVLPK
jgi:hypothetical protein